MHLFSFMLFQKTFVPPEAKVNLCRAICFNLSPLNKMSFCSRLCLIFLFAFSEKMVTQKTSKIVNILKKNLHLLTFAKINHKSLCRLSIGKPGEHHNPVIPPNFEFPVYEAEEEEGGIPEEISRLWHFSSQLP